MQVGTEIFVGKGLCSTCHTIGKSGALRFPDLGGIATAAETRIDGTDALTYLARSIYYPDEFIVPGFTKGMPKIDKPPIGLSDDEIIAVLAYLQSQAGMTVKTDMPGITGPEVEALYALGAAWLAGD